MSIFELPTEVFTILLEELGCWPERLEVYANSKYFTGQVIDDVRSLSCTCRALHAFLSPIVWRNFSSKYFDRNCRPKDKYITMKENNMNNEKKEAFNKYEKK